MRILYAVCGEGNGHATRSLVAIRHLLARGHRVLAAGGGRALAYLRPRVPEFVEVPTFRSRYDADGRFDVEASMLGNALALPGMLLQAGSAALLGDVATFAPEAVATDLEPFAVAYAALRGIPCCSIDNHQAIFRSSHPAAVLRRVDRGELGRVKILADAVAAGCRRCVATTYSPSVVLPERTADTVLVPPVVREPLLRAAAELRTGVRGVRPAEGGVLVYLTDVYPAFGGIGVPVLRSLGQLPGLRFVVYGVGPTSGELAPPNCLVRARFDEDGFARDLAACSAVVANGGYSLLSEAVALGKPALAVPIGRHAEQQVNAAWLAHQGFGERADALEPGAVEAFLRRAPAYARELRAAPRHDGNAALYAELDRTFPPP